MRTAEQSAALSSARNAALAAAQRARVQAAAALQDDRTRRRRARSAAAAAPARRERGPPAAAAAAAAAAAPNVALAQRSASVEARATAAMKAAARLTQREQRAGITPPDTAVPHASSCQVSAYDDAADIATAAACNEIGSQAGSVKDVGVDVSLWQSAPIAGSSAAYTAPRPGSPPTKNKAVPGGEEPADEPMTPMGEAASEGLAASGDVATGRYSPARYDDYEAALDAEMALRRAAGEDAGDLEAGALLTLA